MTAATYEISTDIGKIRLAIADTDIARAWFSDEELQSFLDDTGAVMLAAGRALRSMAAALYDRSIRSATYEEETKGAIKSLLELADSYEDAVVDSPSVPEFVIAQTGWEMFSRRNMFIREALENSP